MDVRVVVGCSGVGARLRTCAMLKRAAATLIGNGQITSNCDDGAILLLKECS